MPLRSPAKTSSSLRIAVLIAGLCGAAIGLMAWYQVNRERQADLEDLNRRASVLVHRLSPSVLDALKRPDREIQGELAPRLEGYRHLIGFAIYRPDGRLVASTKTVPEFDQALRGPVTRVLRGEVGVVEMIGWEGVHLHILARHLQDEDGSVKGVLAVLHDASYLDERINGRLARSAFSVLMVTLLVLTGVMTLTWTVYERPLHRLAEWMRRLRLEEAKDAPPPGLPIADLGTESDRLAASFRAARTKGRTEAHNVARTEKAWTRERLRAHALDCLAGAQLVAVSNREPYIHQFHNGERRAIVPASGLVTALDPVLQACGGLWVAHGAGDADRETTDRQGRLTVPPGDSRYTLRRVWLSREEQLGYYYGFSNEGLWPLCHLTHERPVFRASDWQEYIKANHRFADAVLQEIGSTSAFVLVQDYHLALVPQILKSSRPDLKVGLFWHIPWPNPEAFRICPWRAEILRGMLGADLVGFHLQQHCNNFLDTVDRMVQARLDWDHFALDLKKHTTHVRPFPISVQDWSERRVPSGDKLARQMGELRERHDLEGMQVIVGVDRIDYTKGLIERFRAVELFLTKYPQHRERVVFVQLGAPSRSHIRRYRELITELESLADEINWKFQTEDWKPIRFLVAHHDSQAVYAFLRMASVCLVSSLHDGMNLVAKEFVAAQEDGDGVLVLSEFAGAARELADAILINPYSTEEFADAIHRAMEMDLSERRVRMGGMRKIVTERNIYRWAADFLVKLSEVSDRTGKGDTSYETVAGKR